MISEIEYNILKKRKAFKKRRNLVRRFLLLSFVLCISFFCFKLYEKSTNITPKIYINNSYLVSSAYVEDYIFNYLLGKNFLFISPRSVSSELTDKIPILKNVFIRRYIYPEPKVILFLKEKQLWAKVLFKDRLENQFYYLSDDGCYVEDYYLNLSSIPKEFVVVNILGKSSPNKEIFKILKSNYDFLTKKIKIPIYAFVISEKGDLEIYTTNRFRLKCGKLDELLKIRLSNLNKISDIVGKIRTGYYKSGYLDLRLENAAILKADEDKKPDEKKKGLLKLLKR